MDFNWHTFGLFWLIMACSTVLILGAAWVSIEIERKTGSIALGVGLPVGLLCIGMSVFLGLST